MPEETVGAADMADCTCGPCLKKRGLPHNVHEGVIHGYSSQPRSGWQPRRTRREMTDGTDAPTFGVELETDAPNLPRIAPLAGQPYVPYLPMGADDEAAAEHRRLVGEHDAWSQRNARHVERQQQRRNALGSITAEEAVSIAEPRGFWHAKHDGSVSGPEFASQPATLAYWRENRTHLTSMFKALLHGGMRSHDGGNCGLHVNIGNRAFTDAPHLSRFAALVVANPRWATRMAQRTHEQVSSWSRFDGTLTSATAREEWAAEWGRYGYAGGNRYMVLNANNEGRVEFRLPRGTLRVDRFYAKLEWVASMLEYTRDPDNATTVAAYMRYCKDMTSEYPTLLGYMRERFAGRFETAGEV